MSFIDISARSSNKGFVILFICRLDDVASSIFLKRRLLNWMEFSLSPIFLLMKPCNIASGQWSALSNPLWPLALTKVIGAFSHQPWDMRDSISSRQMTNGYRPFITRRELILGRVRFECYVIHNGAKVYSCSKEAYIASIVVWLRASRLKARRFVRIIRSASGIPGVITGRSEREW